ncbi:MAG: hypothetical protein NVS3B21_18630 [Acidimicrobiales bacterium]
MKNLIAPIGHGRRIIASWLAGPTYVDQIPRPQRREEEGMEPESSVLFAHGSVAMPRMVGTLERAKRLAHDDARRAGTAQPVLAVHLRNPELAVEVLGYMGPDGAYEDLRAIDG